MLNTDPGPKAEGFWAPDCRSLSAQAGLPQSCYRGGNWETRGLSFIRAGPAGEGAEVQSWLWCSYVLCVTVGTSLPSLGYFSICAMGLSWLQEPLDSVPVLGPMERDEAQGTEAGDGMAWPAQSCPDAHVLRLSDPAVHLAT